MERLIKISGIEKSYGKTQALQGVDWEIPRGRIIGVLGPNSAGKTTLLKVIAGLAQPGKGTLEYPDGVSKGIDVKKKISFLPDSVAFPEWMKVKEAFQYHQCCYEDYDKEREQFLYQLLELDSCREEKIKKLSRGMKERVAIGLALSRNVGLYLMDEPLAGIDPVEKSRIMDAILSMKPEQSTIVISTHLVKDVERILDSICLLYQGRILYQEDCDVIREQYGKTVEQKYMEVLINENTVSI